MSGEWTVSEPQKLVFDDGVDTLQVRVAGGAVNVVGVEGGPARLEVSELEGPPLIVRHKGGELNVSYQDLRREGLLQFLDRWSRHRHAVVSLVVPKRTKVMVGVVGASAVVSRTADRTTVRSVGGDITLVDLTGPVSADTVGGGVEAQGVSGDLRVKTVSGDLTVVEGGGKRVGAESVSGNFVLDLASDGMPPGADIRLTTVSGEIAVRITDVGDTEVQAGPTSGAVSCAFDELRVTGQWGWKKITGRVGSGRARLKATTVSGAIALLRRPAAETDKVTEKEL
jgi:hypothetical protein